MINEEMVKRLMSIATGAGLDDIHVSAIFQAIATLNRIDLIEIKKIIDDTYKQGLRDGKDIEEIIQDQSQTIVNYIGGGK